MIISHKNKFIFIKTNKTAGTSVEIMLSSVCGKSDIITPLTSEDELIRLSVSGNCARNYSDKVYNYRASDFVNFLFKGKKKKIFYNHISAMEVKDRINPEIWGRYFKFAIERNPFDKVVSLYNWRCKVENHQSSIDGFKRFIRTDKILRARKLGVDLYSVDGRLLVDHIIKYESLDKDLNDIYKSLDIACPVLLPKTKVTRLGGYREYYSQEDIKIVENIFQDVFERMGYRF